MSTISGVTTYGLLDPYGDTIVGNVMPDTTDISVGERYTADMQAIVNVFNAGAQDGAAQLNQYGESGFTLDQAKTIYHALNDLQGLFENGSTVVSPITGKSSTYYMNLSMATNYDLVLKMFSAAGIYPSFNQSAILPSSPTSPNLIKTLLPGWYALSTAGLQNMLNNALEAGQSWRSIQSMIEIEYVGAGNTLVSNELGNLQEALNYTTQATQALTALQNIYNKVQPADPGTFNLNITSAPPTAPTSSGFMSYYQRESASGNSSFVGFQNPIPLDVTATAQDQAAYTATKGQLQTIINGLEQTTGIGPTDPGYANSLQQSLQQVVDDIQANPNVNVWIKDNLDAAPGTPNGNLSGQNGLDLATAQTAAQSINTQQQEKVQSTLFIFQQFYQSASGLLTTITQLLEKMGAACASN